MSSAIRIISKTEAIGARRGVDLCDPCGAPLAGDRATDKDHIPPKSVLGESPGDDTWRVTLRVHQECHSAKSRLTDQHLATWHTINTTGPEEWNKGNVRSLPVRPRRLGIDNAGRPMPVITNVRVLEDGVWDWVRGCYTFLDGCYLPRAMPRQINPPNPGFVSERVSTFTGRRLSGVSVEETERDKSACLLLLNAALHHDAFDGILAWGGQFQFMCTWVGRTRRKGRATCIWGMAFPGLEKYIRGLRWGAPSWCGEIWVIRPPSDYAVLTQRQVMEFARAVGLPKGP